MKGILESLFLRQEVLPDQPELVEDRAGRRGEVVNAREEVTKFQGLLFDEMLGDPDPDAKSSVLWLR